MVKSKTLPSIVKRRIQFWRYGRLKQRLKDTSTVYGTRIQTGSEAYTSKQCGRCGMINDELRTSEFFRCASCDLVADRDVHAARNILIRFCSIE